jgi:hypothetical protein
MEDATASMSVFRRAELDYLSGGLQLGRIATVGADGTPHVVPVGWIYNAGQQFKAARRFRACMELAAAASISYPQQ